MNDQDSARKCTTCPNAVYGKWKTCLSCRLYKRAANRKFHERRKKKQATAPREKQPWSQERWEAFIQSGGLEGL